MNLRDRSINRYEVETLFTDVLNLNQIEQIGKLLKLLGTYIFVNRGQLDYFAEQIYGECIGPSFLQKAVKYRLIAEIQQDKDFKNFYFQLKAGGFYFLDAIGFKYRRLPLDAARKEREKILAINQYLIAKHYLIDSTTIELFEPLITTTDILLVAEKTKDDVAKLIAKKPYLQVEKMQLTEVKLNEKSEGNEQSMLE